LANFTFLEGTAYVLIKDVLVIFTSCVWLLIEIREKRNRKGNTLIGDGVVGEASMVIIAGSGVKDGG